MKLKKLSSAIAMSILSANIAHAGFGDFRSATWNMQGATAGGESKWHDLVMNMMFGIGHPRYIDRHHVVALQEAGDVPCMAQATGRILIANVTVGTYGNQNLTVTEYTWLQDRNGVPIYVYHMPVIEDQQGNRTNLAIVSRIRATNIIIIPPAFNTNYSLATRAAFGITIANPDIPNSDTTFYTYHAGSHGGNSHSNDAPNLLRLVDTYHAQGEDEWANNGGYWTVNFPQYTTAGNAVAALYPARQPQNAYAVLGDFNRNIYRETDAQARARLEITDATLYRPNHHTHVNLNNGYDGELDYAVAANFYDDFQDDPLDPQLRYRDNPDIAQTRFIAPVLSDHHAVGFNGQPVVSLTEAPTTPTPPPTAQPTNPYNNGTMDDADFYMDEINEAISSGVCSSASGRHLTALYKDVDENNPSTKIWVDKSKKKVFIRLIDHNGNPEPGVKVKFSLFSGTATISSPVGTTNSNGQFATTFSVGNSTLRFLGEFDRLGDGNPDTPVINGNLDSFTFSTGG